MGRSLPSSPPRELLAVAAVVLLGAGLRWLRWERTAAIFNDGPQFLWIAQHMAAGAWGEALSHPYHPLYPFAVVVAHFALPDWEGAAAAVSIATGSLAIAVLYGLLRASFGPRLALAGAALLAVHYRAVSYASDVQSDALYLLLFLTALAAAWRAIERGSAADAGWAGALSGLAYLARPEGLGAAVLAGAFGLVRAARGPWSRLHGAAWLAALAGGLALFVVPYATVLRIETGSWQLTQKKSLRELVIGNEPAPQQQGALPGSPILALSPSGWLLPTGSRSETPRLAVGAQEVVGADRVAPGRAGRPLRAGFGASRRLASALGELLRTAISAARYETLVLLLIGLARSWGPPTLRGRFLLGLALLYGVVLLALTLHAGYVSRRHVLPVLVPAFGYAALGAGTLGRWLLAGIRPGRPRAEVTAAAPLALGLVLAASVALAGQVPPRRVEDLAARRAAEWLRGRVAGKEVPIVATGRQRVAYYAGARYVRLPSRPEGEPGSALAALRARGVRYVIVDRRQPSWLALLRAQPGMRLLRHERTARGEAWVFDLGRPPQGGPLSTSRSAGN